MRCFWSDCFRWREAIGLGLGDVGCSLFAVLGLLVVVRGRDGKMASRLGGEGVGCVGESRGFGGIAFWRMRLRGRVACFGEGMFG